MNKDMEEIIEECERLGKTIEKTKSERSNLEGKLQSSLERLKKEVKLISLTEAEKEHLSTLKKREELENKITKLFYKLDQDYEW